MTARNREQLIHIAARLFLKQGYKYTSIEDICAHSGVSRSNLYFHFKSKDELLFAVVDFWGNRYETALEISLSEAEVSAELRIHHFVELLLSEIEARGNIGACPFIAMYEQSPKEATNVHSRIENFFKGLHQLIASLLKQGVDNGEFRSNLSVQDCAYLFVSALEGSLLLGETLENMDIVRTTLNSYFKMLK